MDSERTPLLQQWTIPSEYGREITIMENVRSTLSMLPDALPRLQDMLTAVSEACLNAMEHGNRMNPFLSVTTNLQISPDCFIFRICDHGQGFTPSTGTRTVTSEENPNTRGWGLLFMTKLADEVQLLHEPEAFCVELKFHRGIQACPNVYE